jgi:hypothetical protein
MTAMRSFGRGAAWVVPGVFYDFEWREYDESVMRGRLFTSRSPERSIYISSSSDDDIAPISFRSVRHSASQCESYAADDTADDFTDDNTDDDRHHQHHRQQEMAWQAASDTAVLRSIIDQGDN